MNRYIDWKNRGMLVFHFNLKIICKKGFGNLKLLNVLMLLIVLSL